MERQLEELVTAVQASAKYRSIAPELIRQLAAQELAKRRTQKEAIKATKNKLHQIAGAYLADLPDYNEWNAALRAAWAACENLRPLCRTWLLEHASTRERVSLLEEFYTQIFNGVPSVTSILDLACGLNPLTIPWMNLEPETCYFACDIYQDQADFFQQALTWLRVKGEAFTCNLLESVPTQTVDVALLLKAIPCLEQADKTIASRLISQVQAKVLIVSFPGRSLGGHSRGMATYYEAHFTQLMHAFPYRYDKIEFNNELVFRIFKHESANP
ncbi:MAG: hypothetical protein U0175_06555 [Caldilineaceae bacterium]